MQCRYTGVVILALGVLCTCSWGAGKSAWVIPDALNVRKSPSTSSDRVATLSKGQKVTVAAFRDDGWCKATLSSGRTGWIREEHLQFSASKKPASTTSSAPSVKRFDGKPAWVNVGTANLRGAPTVSAGLAGKIESGEKVHITARKGGWVKVKSPSGKFGWIRGDLLRYSAPGGSSSATASASGNPPAWIGAGTANVRSGPSVASDRRGQLTKGTKVYVLERRSGWVKCRTPGGSGWIEASLLESTPSGRQIAAGGKDKAYCVGAKVYLRQGPGVNRKDICSVREGSTLWIKEERSGWCKVAVEGGTSGWIAGWYIRRHGARDTVSRDPYAPPAIVQVRHDYPSPDRKPARGKLDPFRAWIAEDHTNIRYGPGVEKDVKFQLAKFTPVKVVDTQGQWCEVLTDQGTRGWTAGWVLDFQPPGESEVSKTVNGREVEAKVGWVNRPTVNLRQGASTEADVAGKVGFGEELVIIDEKADWFKVVLDNGSTGWIAQNLVETRAERIATAYESPDNAPVTTGGSANGLAVAREAMRHLGQSYIRGATGPRAFDCSGLTSYVYRQFGVDLPRTTGGQYAVGRAVADCDLSPGDIVVFQNTYKAGISHVGIFIGQGRFIHASNSRSGVKISDLDQSYYSSRYVGARRVF